MASEKVLNNYYNIGGYNKPARIGYMMNMIRQLKPLTEDGWKIWYFDNVHDESYLNGLAAEMHDSIPASYAVSLQECKDYIYDVMFRRTFQGYNKEKLALQLLRREISHSVQEAPKEWDTNYFIDFYVNDRAGKPIGIQLKPESFYYGHYQYVVDIRGKMQAFCDLYQTSAFVLQYSVDNRTDRISISNPTVIEEIRNLI